MACGVQDGIVNPHGVAVHKLPTVIIVCGFQGVPAVDDTSIAPYQRHTLSSNTVHTYPQIGHVAPPPSSTMTTLSVKIESCDSTFAARASGKKKGTAPHEWSK